MADKASLSDKERALIEAARREVGAGATNPPAPAARLSASPAMTAAPATATAVPAAATATAIAANAPLPGRSQGQAPGAPAAEQPHAPEPSATGNARLATHAARIAALMAAERAEIERRRRLARRWGIHFPMTLFAMALVWMTLRQFG